MSFHIIARRLRPVVRNRGDVRRFVVYSTATIAALALALDVVHQLSFFESWAVAFRSWLITLAVVAVISVPVFNEVARVHLKLSRINAKLKKLSNTDPLTGLMNRRALVEYSTAASDAEAVLVIIDLDRFKTINDRHGHLVGDFVLKAMAARLREEFGAAAAVCRLGGEEFAVMLSAADPSSIVDQVDQFRARIANMPIVAKGAALRVSFSAGVAIGRGGFDKLYADADRALYEAKTIGRNQVVMSTKQ